MKDRFLPMKWVLRSILGQMQPPFWIHCALTSTEQSWWRCTSYGFFFFIRGWQSMKQIVIWNREDNSMAWTWKTPIRGVMKILCQDSMRPGISLTEWTYTMNWGGLPWSLQWVLRSVSPTWNAPATACSGCPSPSKLRLGFHFSRSGGSRAFRCSYSSIIW